VYYYTSEPSKLDSTFKEPTGQSAGKSTDLASDQRYQRIKPVSECQQKFSTTCDMIVVIVKSLCGKDDRGIIRVYMYTCVVQ